MTIVAKNETVPPSFTVLTEAEQNGWPHMASLALLVSEVDERLPDADCLDAIARRNRQAGDLQTAIGAARTFGERNCEVKFIGAIAPELQADPRIKTHIDWLLDHSQTDYDDSRSPTPADVETLLSDLDGRWSMLLHVSGISLGLSQSVVKPTVVLGLSGDKLAVYNPSANAEARRRPTYINVHTALGSIATKRTSLLAIRQPQTQHYGIRLAY